MQLYADESHLRPDMPSLLHSVSRQCQAFKASRRANACAHRITPETEFTGADATDDFGSLSQHEVDVAISMGLMPLQAQVALVITTQGVMPETVEFGAGWLR